MKLTWILPALVFLLSISIASSEASDGREILFSEIGAAPAVLTAEAGPSREFSYRLPEGADAFILPMSAGIRVDTSDSELLRRLREGSPWSLIQLPLLGVRYGDRTLVVIVPWPQYAELVVTDRLEIRFQFPVERNNVTPCELVVQWAGKDPLEAARVFREWRASASDLGSIPRPRPLSLKAQQVPRISALYGAPHFYLWGSAVFSRFDVRDGQWPALARRLAQPTEGSLAAAIAGLFSDSERNAVSRILKEGRAAPYLAIEVAGGLARVLADRALLGLAAEVPSAAVIDKNREAFAAQFSGLVNEPGSWGDGPSVGMLEALHGAGIEHAVVLLGDFYGNTSRPDLATRAEALGYLFGPYDSYHTVHSPDARPDDTWETAQFDRPAYEEGRVLNADGSGHVGFRGTGYHFAPSAAWPYVQSRVRSAMASVPYSTWFVDCDATGEWFDDYSPSHPASRVDDMKARRNRLEWLRTEFGLPIGSEEGTVLMADLVDFGHGVQTPFIGHLDPAFRDRKSPYFLGAYWPSDAPASFFKEVPVAPSVVRPYFDPRVRIPLYQAVLGDELIGTHHWSFDSLKFRDLAASRELMEILYMVPPLYHISRATWPERRDRIVRHVSFWAPLHRQLAPVRLTRFEWLSADRLLQRTTFRGRKGEVTITVNFAEELRESYPPLSATVAGTIDAAEKVYRAGK